MRLKKPSNAGSKRHKFRAHIKKPGTSTEPKLPAAHMTVAPLKVLPQPKKWARLERRMREVHANGREIVSKPFAIPERSLFDPVSTETCASEPPRPLASAKAKAKAKTKPKAGAGANAKETAPMAATAMPPGMARKKQVAADRIDQIVQCPARARKEIARLNALISKLTAQPDKVKPKELYFDENWLAARWGMSVKHIRNLRAAGIGPRVTYFGRSVRYRLRHVVAFEKANAFASPTDRDQSR